MRAAGEIGDNAVEDGDRRRGQLQPGRVEGRRQESGGARVDQIAGAGSATARQIPRIAAAGDQRATLARRERVGHDTRGLEPRIVPDGEQDRFAIGQDLWPAMTEFSLLPGRDFRGSPASRRDPPHTGSRGGREIDEVVYRPRLAASIWRLTYSHRLTTGQRNLFQSAAGEEPDPFAVR